MGSETTYSGVIGGLGLHLAKLVAYVVGIAQQGTAFTASEQEASRQLQKVLMEGRRVASRASGMTKLLQERTRSEKLEELGRQPFRGPEGLDPEVPTALRVGRSVSDPGGGPVDPLKHPLF